jgi:ribosome-associated protein
MMEFKLENGEYIELNKLLKTMSLIESGGMAKQIILDELVLVNNEVENKIRKKLRVGDVVEFDGNKVKII